MNRKITSPGKLKEISFYMYMYFYICVNHLHFKRISFTDCLLWCDRNMVSFTLRSYIRRRYDQKEGVSNPNHIYRRIVNDDLINVTNGIT